VQCDPYAHCLIIDFGKKEICKVRKNKDRTLYTIAYGRTITKNIDPVKKTTVQGEKK